MMLVRRHGGYIGGMKLPQFTIRDLLLSTALIAAGVGSVVDPYRDRSPHLFFLLLWIGGGALESGPAYSVLSAANSRGHDWYRHPLVTFAIVFN